MPSAFLFANATAFASGKPLKPSLDVGQIFIVRRSACPCFPRLEWWRWRMRYPDQRWCH